MKLLRSSGIPNIGEFLDDHEEQHAVGTGIGVGFAAVASGDLQQLAIVGVLFSEVMRRKRRPEPSGVQDLANDIRREAHYFIAAVAIGGVLGILARGAVGRVPIPMPSTGL